MPKSFDDFDLIYEDTVSPLDVARHPHVYRKVPGPCHSLWVNACRLILSRYKKASIESDSGGMHAAVVALLLLPSRVLMYNSSFSGKRKSILMQKMLEEAVEKSSYFFETLSYPDRSASPTDQSLGCMSDEVDGTIADDSGVRDDESVVSEGQLPKASYPELSASSAVPPHSSKAGVGIKDLADERTIRKCKSLVREGHVALAVRALLQAQFLDPLSPVVKKKIQDLHHSFDGVTPICPYNIKGSRNCSD